MYEHFLKHPERCDRALCLWETTSSCGCQQMCHTWKGLIFWAFQFHPLLPALGGANEVIWQAGVFVHCLQPGKDSFWCMLTCGHAPSCKISIVLPSMAETSLTLAQSRTQRSPLVGNCSWCPTLAQVM